MSTSPAAETPAEGLVFLSHASEDRELAEQLCRSLEGRGVPCWIAPRNIPPGSDWVDGISDGLRRSRATVVLVGEHSVTSEHVRNEVGIAVDHGHLILPVRLQAVPLGRLDYHLRTKQWIDVLDGSVEKVLPNILKALQGDAPAMQSHPLEPLAVTHSIAFAGWMIAMRGDDDGIDASEREAIRGAVMALQRTLQAGEAEAAAVTDREVEEVFAYAESLDPAAQIEELKFHLALLGRHVPPAAGVEIARRLFSVAMAAEYDERKRIMMAWICKDLGVEPKDLRDTKGTDEEDVDQGGAKSPEHRLDPATQSILDVIRAKFHGDGAAEGDDRDSGDGASSSRDTDWLVSQLESHVEEPDDDDDGDDEDDEDDEDDDGDDDDEQAEPEDDDGDLLKRVLADVARQVAAATSDTTDASNDGDLAAVDTGPIAWGDVLGSLLRPGHERVAAVASALGLDADSVAAVGGFAARYADAVAEETLGDLEVALVRAVLASPELAARLRSALERGNAEWWNTAAAAVYRHVLTAESQFDKTPTGRLLDPATGAPYLVDEPGEFVGDGAPLAESVRFLARWTPPARLLPVPRLGTGGRARALFAMPFLTKGLLASVAEACGVEVEPLAVVPRMWALHFKEIELAMVSRQELRLQGSPLLATQSHLCWWEGRALRTLSYVDDMPASAEAFGRNPFATFNHDDFGLAAGDGQPRLFDAYRATSQPLSQSPYAILGCERGTVLDGRNNNTWRAYESVGMAAAAQARNLKVLRALLPNGPDGPDPVHLGLREDVLALSWHFGSFLMQGGFAAFVPHGLDPIALEPMRSPAMRTSREALGGEPGATDPAGQPILGLAGRRGLRLPLFVEPTGREERGAMQGLLEVLAAHWETVGRPEEVAAAAAIEGYAGKSWRSRHMAKAMAAWAARDFGEFARQLGNVLALLPERFDGEQRLLLQYVVAQIQDSSIHPRRLRLILQYILRNYPKDVGVWSMYFLANTQHVEDDELETFLAGCRERVGADFVANFWAEDGQEVKCLEDARPIRDGDRYFGPTSDDPSVAEGEDWRRDTNPKFCSEACRERWIAHAEERMDKVLAGAEDAS